jgi:hypothetical protein
MQDHIYLDTPYTASLNDLSTTGAHSKSELSYCSPHPCRRYFYFDQSLIALSCWRWPSSSSPSTVERGGQRESKVSPRVGSVAAVWRRRRMVLYHPDVGINGVEAARASQEHIVSGCRHSLPVGGIPLLVPLLSRPRKPSSSTCSSYSSPTRSL